MIDRGTERAVELGQYIIKTGATVRAAARIFHISKSTVHKDISERLKKIDPPLYRKVKKIMDKNRAELIAGIEKACHHYLENRINPMDKSILLIAMAEIMFFDEIPPVVSVSEAAGLARKYSTETSADFVNGVLAGVINK